jgi:hypothetical protein
MTFIEATLQFEQEKTGRERMALARGLLEAPTSSAELGLGTEGG